MPDFTIHKRPSGDFEVEPLPDESAVRCGKELERRLQEWAGEYAGGRFEDIGWPGISQIATMMKYHGRAPDGLSVEVVAVNTPADDVEAAVAELEKTRDGLKPGKVLRCEYWMTRAPEEQKLQVLRKSGLPMSRQGYYGYLKLARFHVAAWLRIPA